MKMNEKTLRTRNFLNENVRGFIAVAVSLLLIPYGQPALFGQDPPPPPAAYAQLGAEQLNQLVAPIALYPDSLVAQILTAATYPQQVMEAANWARQNGGMPPQQVAAAADTMPWDPSVKALTAFPSVLNNLAQNNNWTAALGNAYYNQPGDVMNAVQAMRMQAQAAGTLRTDAHYRVYNNAGLVVIAPIDPALVYVPYYNPWVVYGAPIAPWRGYYWAGPPRGVVLAGIGLGFGIGISVGLFAHYGWGYHHWEPNWHGGVVVYNHTTYISRSTTVINHGNFGYHNRGVYERPGPGVPHNFRPAVTAQSAAFRPGQGRPGEFRGSNYANRPAPGPANGQQFGRPQQGQPVRPQNQQTTREGQRFGQPRPQGQPTQPQGNYSRPQQTYRPPATGGTNPQVNRPSGNSGTFHPQNSSPRVERPQSTPPPSHAQGPSHPPREQHRESAPSHSGGQHSPSRSEKHR